MKVFLLALCVVALCVFGMCFNIIFRKDGEFPQYEVGENEKMKEIGIKCMHQEEAGLHSGKTKKKPVNCNESCSNCRETECR